MNYDAFISYSHSHDKSLSVALQQGLQKLGKPWYKLYQLKVFRDESDLSATPDLWKEIEKALGQSEYFVILASPKAAASKWIKKEVDFWFSHKKPENLIIVLTDGYIAWEDSLNDYDWETTTALPVNFKGKARAECLVIGLSDIRTQNDLSLNNPLFKEKVARVSAAIQGISLRELIDKDVIEHRKTLSLRNGVITTIALFLIGLIISFIVILNQRNKALITARANEHVSKALVRNSTTMSMHHLWAAYQLTPTPFIANLLKGYTSNPTTFYDYIDLEDTVSTYSMLKLGDELFTGHNSGILRKWDKRGNLVAETRLALSEVNRVLSIKNTNFLVVTETKAAVDTQFIYVLNSKDLEVVYQFTHPARLRAITISGEDRIVTGNWDGEVRFLALNGDSVKKILLLEEDGDVDIEAILQPDSNSLVILADGQVRKYSTTGQFIIDFTADSVPVKEIALNLKNGDILGIDNLARAFLWDANGNKKNEFNPYTTGLKKKRDGESSGTCLFSTAGTVATIIDNCYVAWNEEGEVNYTARLLYDRMSVAAVSSTDPDEFVTGGLVSDIFFWNAKGFRQGNFQVSQKNLGFSADGTRYMVSDKDSVVIHEVSSRRKLVTIPTSKDWMSRFDYYKDEMFFFYQYEDTCLALYKKHGYSYIDSVICVGKQITSVCYDHRAHSIYTGTNDGYLGVINLKKGNSVFKQVSDKEGMEVSFVRFNHEYILVAGGKLMESGFVKLFSKDLKEFSVLSGHDAEVTAGNFSPDGTIFATCDFRGELIAWDAKTKKKLFEVEADLGYLSDVAISDDNSFFLTGSPFTLTVNLFDRNGNLLQSHLLNSMIGHTGFIDGDKFFASTQDGEIHQFYTWPGFMKSERIIPLDQMRDEPTISINEEWENVFTLDRTGDY